jgi:hypothetical protein
MPMLLTMDANSTHVSIQGADVNGFDRAEADSRDVTVTAGRA